MIGQGELRTPHAAREHKQKLYVPPSGDIIIHSYFSFSFCVVTSSVFNIPKLSEVYALLKLRLEFCG